MTSPLEFGFLVLAGVAGGLFGSGAGLASLATYSALLAIGLPPVTANVTNTVALIFSSIGAIAGSGPELTGQRARLKQVVPIALLGGAVGAALLLTTPATSFKKLVPILLGIASLTIVIPRRRAAGGPAGAPRPGMVLFQRAATFLIAVYGGYFGAAAGVLFLALLLQTTRSDLPRANATKNVLVGAANSVAAVAFIFLAPVVWSAVIPMGIGCLVGARWGPILVRRAPALTLRLIIGAAGFVLAITLGIKAWG